MQCREKLRRGSKRVRTLQPEYVLANWDRMFSVSPRIWEQRRHAEQMRRLWGRSVRAERRLGLFELSIRDVHQRGDKLDGLQSLPE